MAFAFEVLDTIRTEEPELFDDELDRSIVSMMVEAVECETQFAEDLLGGGVPGLSLSQMTQYLKYVADQRLARLDIDPHFRAKNPLSFMDLQDVQEVANFFERRVSAYQVGVTGEVEFDCEF
jgi:ribonucleoside-diphosphate reductase beta chain